MTKEQYIRLCNLHGKEFVDRVFHRSVDYLFKRLGEESYETLD